MEQKHCIRIERKFSKLNEENHTSIEWFEMVDNFKKCIVEIPKWVSLYFLESMPPIYGNYKGSFFNSEPVDYNKEGKALYYYFFEYRKKHYGAWCSIDTQDFIMKLFKESIKGGY